MFKHIVVLLMLSSSLLSLDTKAFIARREEVRKQLGPRSAMILLTAEEYYRNGDVKYKFRPDSDYWYLTGHHEPGGTLLLVSNDFAGANKVKFKKEVIFTEPRDPRHEVWVGRRLGIEGVRKKLGFQYVSVPDSVDTYLEGILSFMDTLYVNRKINGQKLNLPSSLEPLIRKTEIKVLNAGEIIHPLRHIKSAEEIELLQQAIDITGIALEQAIRRARPGLKENQIEATIEFIFRENGSERRGFPSIVGSGPNSTILHYVSNNQTMHRGDLLLMDVGAEYEMYTADITRTIPVNGRFTDAQRELYAYVLGARQAVLDSVAAGMTLREIHMIAKRYLERSGYGRYFIHGVSHWLGLDVHDVGGYEARIKVGSVFTIEPGIYIPENDSTVTEEYRGNGIRIEDDILMTEDGPICLSQHIPREAKEIEALMRRKPNWRM